MTDGTTKQQEVAAALDVVAAKHGWDVERKPGDPFCWIARRTEWKGLPAERYTSLQVFIGPRGAMEAYDWRGLVVKINRKRSYFRPMWTAIENFLSAYGADARDPRK